jgi:beta-galactosidase
MGTSLLSEPLMPCFWRVPTDNDEGGGNGSFAARWRKAGLNTYSVKVNDIKTDNLSGKATVHVKAVLEFKAGSMEVNTQYHFSPAGETDVQYQVKLMNKFPPLARVGVEFAVPASYDQLKWFGRGPFESYRDRKESAEFGLYSGRVADQYFPYVMPQENGNKTDVEWFSITGLNRGLKVVCHTPLNMNVQDYSQKALNDAKTSHELLRGDYIYVHIDLQQMGLGGDDSWNPRVHPEYQLTDEQYQFGFTIQLF